MLCKLSKSFSFATVNFAILLIFVQYCFSAPVGNIYVNFINDLNSNECATPEQIQLPSNSSSAESLELLSSSLKICQNLDTVTHIKEAQYLCREIFDNLKVVLCRKGIIKPLNITLSKQVCKDIASLKNVSENTFLLKHLTDNWSCDMLCDAEFEKACQVLHWSYQAKMDFEGTENINKKVNTANATQESSLVSVKEKSQKPNKEKENAQKTAEMTQDQTKGTEQRPTHTLALSTQKINPLLEHHAHDQVDKPQPNINSEIKPLIHINLKDAVSNSILPVLQGKDMSHNVAPKPPQEDVVNNNEFPENEIADNNAGIPEIEEPHDKEDIFPHNAEPDGIFNKDPLQPPINNQLPNIPENIQLPNMPANIRMPNQPTNNELPHFPANDLSPANEGLQQPNPNDGLLDPHDGQELSEEESPRTNPQAQGSKTTVGQTQPIKIEVSTQNEANVQTQAKQTTTQNGSSTTKTALSTASSSTSKAASSIGSTKSSTAAAEKKAIEVKSSSAGEVSSISAVGKKTTESLSSSPSLKDASSSVVSPISEDVSPAVANIERMEGEEDAHEMPEDREPEYTDLEKTDGDPDDPDYARQYENVDGIYKSSKNKGTKPEKANELEVSKADDGDQKEPAFEEIPPRRKYPDDVPLIPVVFPEQEDGHFFFYFLSMVLILMAGYLIFHNKQKIIALIVEGRHERRRRSHGAGYKKLETK